MSNLAFVKIPKTGTQTIEDSLRPVFVENPCLTSMHLTVEQFSSHGHAHDFITMVRDPLQQYISAYYYTKNKMNAAAIGAPPTDGRPRVLREHRLVISATASLEEYLLNAPVDDFLVKYTAGTTMDDFIFVGETNHMDESLALLTAVTGIPTHSEWANRNPKRPMTLQPYWVPADVEAAFKARNAGEYEVYAKGVERFESLKAKWLQ